MYFQPHQLNRIRDRYGAFFTKQPVFIYQMGKVGSTAIEESLRAGGVAVRHLHSIGGDFSDQFRLPRSGRSFTARWRRAAEGALQALLLKIPNRRVKVITIVREPLARNISAFFQVLRKVLWDNPEFDSRREGSDNQLLREAFNRQMRHEAPALWFDREIRRQLGVDVYRHPFDHEQGWTLVSENNIDLLILRAEDLIRCESAIGKFAGLPGLRLNNANCGDRKWYAPLYKSFRTHFAPEPELLDRLYGTRYMRHFYTTREIMAFRENWLTRQKLLSNAS
jgi:glycosyltransferase involved in cell wall biosynthesis